MRSRILMMGVLFIAVTFVCISEGMAAPKSELVRCNVVANQAMGPNEIDLLNDFGVVKSVIPEINGATLMMNSADIPVLEGYDFVEHVALDAERFIFSVATENGAASSGGAGGGASPNVDTVPVEDLSEGLSTWNLDAINISNMTVQDGQIVGGERDVAFDGEGVYVAVLDTGLLHTWRQYFPQERIAEEYAICFGGGDEDKDPITEETGKWGRDVDGHGTAATSVILGFALGGTPINGVAPRATVIPVKVIDQSGKGWASVNAIGIVYVANLKAGPLVNHPMVINLSQGGPAADPLERAAIDYAMAQGVIVVAAAGDYGMGGMAQPAAYAPVISVAASGWVNEWQPQGNNGWWMNLDFPEVYEIPYPMYYHHYIVDFSSRGMAGQDLDCAAPGTWIVAPYQLDSGKPAYYFRTGTSMAAPHVAGVVALMAEKQPLITAGVAELLLESTAMYLPPGGRYVTGPSTQTEVITWGANATGSGVVDAKAALNATQ